MGEKLFRAAKTPKSFHPLKGAGHNDTYLVGGPAYFDTLEVFAGTAALPKKDGAKKPLQ